GAPKVFKGLSRKKVCLCLSMKTRAGKRNPRLPTRPGFFNLLGCRKESRMKYIGFDLSLVLAFPAFSAVQKKEQAPASKTLVGEGVSFGGLAGTGFTLMDLRLSQSKEKKLERIVIDVGDMNGTKIIGWPGYYYAELKKNPAQLIVDFSQMPNSLVNQ